MIRQAHTYLVGAMSGATLIAIAIAVFVVLVSAQVFRDWPLAALGGGNDDAAVSQAKPLGNAGTSNAGAGTATIAAGASAGAGAGSGGGGVATGNRDDRKGARAVDATSAPVDTPGLGGGSSGGTTESGSGGGAGTTAPQTTAPAPSGSNTPVSNGGGNRSGASGSNSGGSSGGGGSEGGAGAGGGVIPGGGGGGGASTAGSTSGELTETVNDTVSQVDQTVTGGTLEKTGVTGLTEEVVNGVAGPESTVGKVVDETVNAVNGLLGGKK